MRETLINNFLRISSIPRKTGYEKKISDFFVKVAKENDLEYYQDEFYNVLIKKKGNIKGDSICLQAHFDMVCVKTSDSNHDFLNEGINVVIDNDKVTAKDTSLGADQGVGLAIMLTLIEDKTIKHPDLEFFFTVEEETTFKGVINFDYSKLQSKLLINLDYDNDKEVVIGSAGDFVNEYKYSGTLTTKDMPSYRVIVDGFKSGNSGVDINASSDSAIYEVARLIKDKEIYIKSINGGSFENDLASSCEVVLQSSLDIYSLFDGYSVTVIDNNESLSLNDTSNIINEILSLKGGYFSKTASCNLGTIRTNNNETSILYLIRSTDINEIEAISDNTKKLNYNFECDLKYKDSIWKPDMDSRLLKKYKEVYYSLYNEYPNEVICQGGVEAGSIKKRTMGMDVISFGANMDNIHSTKEVTYISSWEKIFNILVNIFNS